MNFQDCDEVRDRTPTWATALGPCQNTNIRDTKPFDQVLFATAPTRSEIPEGVRVIHLPQVMEDYWDSANGVYPGAPLNAGVFDQVYSDHNPIAFEILVDGMDDD